MSESKKIYPYDDDFMTFDESTKKYYLTENAIYQAVPGYESLIIQNNGNSSVLIKSITRRVSALVYNHIHKFSTNNDRQDMLIAKIPSLRKIIYEALLNQAVYMIAIGDASTSLKEGDRRLALDTVTEDILNTTVPELGVPITYCGMM